MELSRVLGTPVRSTRAVAEWTAGTHASRRGQLYQKALRFGALYPVRASKAVEASLSCSLRPQPICNCLGLIFLKIICICLAREWTPVSVRFIRMPIALELSPVSANRRSLSSSPCVHDREAKCAGSVIARLVWRATSLKALSMSGCIDHCLRSRRGSFEKITLILPALTISEARLTGRMRPLAASVWVHPDNDDRR